MKSVHHMVTVTYQFNAAHFGGFNLSEEAFHLLDTEVSALLGVVEHVLLAPLSPTVPALWMHVDASHPAPPHRWLTPNALQKVSQAFFTGLTATVLPFHLSPPVPHHSDWCSRDSDVPCILHFSYLEGLLSSKA